MSHPYVTYLQCPPSRDSISVPSEAEGSPSCPTYQSLYTPTEHCRNNDIYIYIYIYSILFWCNQYYDYYNKYTSFMTISHSNRLLCLEKEFVFIKLRECLEVLWRTFFKQHIYCSWNVLKHAKKRQLTLYMISSNLLKQDTITCITEIYLKHAVAGV